MFPSIVMKDINEIVSALLDGTLQESETIELKRTLMIYRMSSTVIII